MDAGQDQNGASGMFVEEKESRHSESRDAMWGTLKCHRKYSQLNGVMGGGCELAVLLPASGGLR